MLLWKSWRDLRPFVFATLIWFALLVAVVLYHAPEWHGHLTPVQDDPRLVSIIGGFVYLQVVVLAFIAVGMGTRGVGHDIGEGGGSFVLTRPVRRAVYIWTEWTASLAALACLLFFGICSIRPGGSFRSRAHHLFRQSYSGTV